MVEQEAGLVVLAELLRVAAVLVLLLLRRLQAEEPLVRSSLPILNLLDKGWPFAGSVCAGLIMFGSVHSDVSNLKQAQAAAQIDHDTVIALKTGQADMKQDLTDIKAALNRLEHK